MDKQQQKMKKMADKLKKCANCMKPGANGQKQPGQKGGQKPGEGSPEEQAKAAGQSLEELAEEIEGMQQQLQDLEDLEDLQDLAEDLKDQMQGGGGDGEGNGKGDWAQGSGTGSGKRHLEKENIGKFKTRDKGSLQKGQTVVTGDADGENISGRSVSQTRELVKASMSNDSDPLQDMKLPKSRREHGQEYFKSLRGAQ